MHMDVNSAIKRILKTGKVVYGLNQSLKKIANKKVKLMIISKNIPKELKDKIEYYCKISGTKIFTYPGSSLELGEVCGKPFLVSSLAVLDEGDVDITELVKESKT